MKEPGEGQVHVAIKGLSGPYNWDMPPLHRPPLPLVVEKEVPFGCTYSKQLRVLCPTTQ